MANDLEKLAQHLAKNIAALREHRRLTQGQLAKLSGIPRSTMTYLESGRGNPSLANLAKISQTLQVSLEELLAKPREQSTLIRYADLPRQTKAKGLAAVLPLLPEPLPGFQIERLELQPRARLGGTPHLVGTREFFTCMTGNLSLTVGELMHELGPGDVVAFPGDQTHAYHNHGSTKMVGISVVSLMVI